MLKLNDMLEDILDIFLPNTCISCSNYTLSKEVICKACLQQLRPDIYRKDLPGVSGGLISFYPYSHHLKKMIGYAKFQNNARLLLQLSYLIDSFNHLEAVNSCRFVPVPMYRTKQRTRGFNSAEILFAHGLSKYGFSFSNELIRRIKNTAALFTLNPSERIMELHGAFEIRKPPESKADIVILDDIFTTGATVAEMIKTFTAARYRVRQVITFCYVEERE